MSGRSCDGKYLVQTPRKCTISGSSTRGRHPTVWNHLSGSITRKRSSPKPVQGAPEERSTGLVVVLALKYPGPGGATSRRMTAVNRRHPQAYKGCRRTGPVLNSRRVGNPKPKLGSSSLIPQPSGRRSAQSQIAAEGNSQSAHRGRRGIMGDERGTHSRFPMIRKKQVVGRFALRPVLKY